MHYDAETVKAWAGDSQWRALRADWARFRGSGYSAWGSEGFWALALYRLQRSVGRAEPRWAWAPVRMALQLVRKLFVLLISVDLHPSAHLGPGLIIPHGKQIIVHGGARVGADCCLQHLSTIGAGSKPGVATIGDHVWIGCCTSIIGPVQIGDGAVVAANSLVIHDVPAWHTAMGVPAQVAARKPSDFSQSTAQSSAQSSAKTPAALASPP